MLGKKHLLKLEENNVMRLKTYMVIGLIFLLNFLLLYEIDFFKIIDYSKTKTEILIFIAIILYFNILFLLSSIDLLIIRPTLKKNNKPVYFWTLKVAKYYPSMLKDYKNICIKNNESLNYYRLMKFLYYFLFISLLLGALYFLIFLFIYDITR
jgi:hypothetical protein